MDDGQNGRKNIGHLCLVEAVLQRIAVGSSPNNSKVPRRNANGFCLRAARIPPHRASTKGNVTCAPPAKAFAPGRIDSGFRKLLHLWTCHRSVVALANGGGNRTTS